MKVHQAGCVRCDGQLAHIPPRLTRRSDACACARARARPGASKSPFSKNGLFYQPNLGHYSFFGVFFYLPIFGPFCDFFVGIPAKIQYRSLPFFSLADWLGSERVCFAPFAGLRGLFFSDASRASMFPLLLPDSFRAYTQHDGGMFAHAVSPLVAAYNRIGAITCSIQSHWGYYLQHTIALGAVMRGSSHFGAVQRALPCAPRLRWRTIAWPTASARRSEPTSEAWRTSVGLRQTSRAS